jgi:diacylglycerol kinase
MFGFNNAIRGLSKAFSTERNFRIQFIFFLIVVGFGIYFKISNYEWLTIILISAFILSLELVNSAIEKLCDLYSPEYNSQIKWIKDVAAGAVLIASLSSIIVGGIVFIPKIISLIN